MRCSAARMRAASESGVSAGSTGTAACRTMGPSSSSGVTTWTVAPLTLTPCSHARRWASSPAKAGSREGWTLRMAFGNAATKPAPSRRMNPARQTRLTSRRSSSSTAAASKASRAAWPACRRTTVSMPARRARSRPGASRRLETTTAISASSRRPAIASMIACRLLPRPEMSTPSLRPGRQPADAESRPLTSRTPPRRLPGDRPRRTRPGGRRRRPRRLRRRAPRRSRRTRRAWRARGANRRARRRRRGRCPC